MLYSNRKKAFEARRGTMMFRLFLFILYVSRFSSFFSFLLFRCLGYVVICILPFPRKIFTFSSSIHFTSLSSQPQINEASICGEIFLIFCCLFFASSSSFLHSNMVYLRMKKHSLRFQIIYLWLKNKGKVTKVKGLGTI
jgi:hypothetical protein